MGPHRDAKPLQADCFFFLEHVFGVVFFCVKWCFQRRNVEILLEILQPSGSYFFFLDNFTFFVCRTSRVKMFGALFSNIYELNYLL